MRRKTAYLAKMKKEEAKPGQTNHGRQDGRAEEREISYPHKPRC
jgi:hypothetical protein